VGGVDRVQWGRRQLCVTLTQDMGLIDADLECWFIFKDAVRSARDPNYTVVLHDN